MKKMKNLLIETVKKYAYLKLCWVQAMGHVNIPLTIFQNVLILATFLKVFEVNNWFAVVVFAVVLLCGIFLVGHMAITYGLTSYETSLTNKYNPEITKIKEEVTKNGKKE
jgi:hypothetical protein